MVVQRKILVTGLSGVVGSAIRPALEKGYHVSSLTRRGAPGLARERNFQADIGELEAIRPAFSGVDTVVHLAATGGVQSPMGTRTGFSELQRTNIVGTYNVFEAAANAGLRRIVFASSGATVRGYENSSPYRELARGEYQKLDGPVACLAKDVEPRPMSLYGVTKLFGEALGRFYAETTALSVISLRIGSVRPENRPRDVRGRAVFVSHRDLAELVVKSIEAPARVRFDIFYGVSDNTRGYRDLSHAREILGYSPQDDADALLGENRVDVP